MDRTQRDAARRAAEARARARRQARTATRLTRAELRRREREFYARPRGLSPRAIAALAEDRPDVLGVGRSAAHDLALRYIEWSRDQCYGDRFVALLGGAIGREPRFGRPDLLRSFLLVATQEPAADVRFWRPRGRGVLARFRSLVDHQLTRWPVPAFLYDAFVEENWHVAEQWVGILSRLGRGESLRAMVDDGTLPVPLSKRARALLLGTRKGRRVVAAVRHAQVAAWGGSADLAAAVASCDWGLVVHPHEAFQARIVQWLCRHPEVAPVVALAYLEHAHRRRIAEGDFRIAGRTVASLDRELAAAQHEEDVQHLEKRLKGATFPDPDVPGGIWELPDTGEFGGPAVWTVDPIRTARHLGAEGRSMRHCVFSYGESILEGDCSIWTLRREGSRCLTVEVDGDRVLVQARGRLNRDPTATELAVLKRWASEAELTLSADFND